MPGVSWPTLPGLANDQSLLINNGRLSPFGGVFTVAVASLGASAGPRRGSFRVSRGHGGRFDEDESLLLCATLEGSSPTRPVVPGLRPSHRHACRPPLLAPRPVPSPPPLTPVPTSPRGFVTNLSQAHSIRSHTTTLAHQPPRAVTKPPQPSVSASAICIPPRLSLGRTSLEPGTGHSPRPQMIRNTRVESHQQLFFQRSRQRGARNSGAARENEP